MSRSKKRQFEVTRRDFLAAFPALAAGAPQIFKKRPAPPPQPAVPEGGKVYILLWFDTEDYILPQSDDAAKRLAVFLTQQGIRGTFKLVGEKARVLNQRNRSDVIAALSRHEIGYHSNTHSQHPTVAEYESAMEWQSGADEFTRRERQGFDTVKRILAQTPSCYGQPGASWAPQVYAALKDWGVRVYLDDGKHVGLDGNPFWYGGLLNIYNLRDGGQLRPDETWSNLADAKADFQDIHLRLTSRRQGGLVSLYFHPCEFIEKEFWDAVNFARGASPAPVDWKLPPMKSPEESEKAFQFFEQLVIYMKSLPRVEFLTASQTLPLFNDAAERRVYPSTEIASIASQVVEDVSYQEHDDYVLSAGEIFFLLTTYVAQAVQKSGGQPILLDGAPVGPDRPTGGLTAPLTVPWFQFSRSVLDVAGYLRKYNQIPNAVWFGSLAVPPESFLLALAKTTTALTRQAVEPDSVTVESARLSAAKYVADDSPGLWDWVIFPTGFHSPHLMELAKLQAWTLKPARLGPTPS